MEEIEYFNKAKEYLLTFENITEKMLEIQLGEWKERKPTDLQELFRAFLEHAKNRQGMPNSIGDIGNLSDLLFSFDHIKVLNKYQTWENLFNAIKDSDYSPPGRMVITNNKSYWVIYCKAVMSVARFLRVYDNLEQFEKFVNGFLTNEQSKLALPLLLEKEIFGFGFALACDFLKENVSPEFIKPDTHINYIAQGLGITDSPEDWQIFKDVISYCGRIDILPYEVDKLFWLVGSGNFYLFQTIINSSKEKFIANIIFKTTYETLAQIYEKHRRKYRENSCDSQQMCLMWSTDDPPDVIEETEPFRDIEKAFGICIDDDTAGDLYDMTLNEAAMRIIEIQKG